jgi:hypothetical protein
LPALRSSRSIRPVDHVPPDVPESRGEGLGGGLALVIALFFGIVLSFLTPAEVGRLYERRGQQAPVSAVTGLWTLLGVIILIGPIVWFVKTNGALNAYWRSVGARG